MSDPCKLRFTTWIDQKTDGAMLGEVVIASEHDAALSQLAALREELDVAKRDEHNSEVAYKAAIEKQEEFRVELKLLTVTTEGLINAKGDALQRLADAEQRNAELHEALTLVTDGGFDPDSGFSSWGAVRINLEDWDIIKAAITKPEEAKS